jgi:hypothetical protein
LEVSSSFEVLASRSRYPVKTFPNSPAPVVKQKTAKLGVKRCPTILVECTGFGGLSGYSFGCSSCHL